MNDKYFDFDRHFDKYKSKDKWKDIIFDPFNKIDDEEESRNNLYIDYLREYMSDNSLNPEPPKKTAEEVKMENRKQKIDILLS